MLQTSEIKITILKFRLLSIGLRVAGSVRLGYPTTHHNDLGKHI
jgi:hypothetical protein